MCLSVPGQLIKINDRSDRPDDAALWRTGKVSFGGVVKEVSLAYVPDAVVGDYVIVHVGFALSIVDQEEAEETLSYLDKLELTLD
ncbi:MAG: HypC/HybG/HupF family hydrogenase formation chaperone [Cyanothece sp. SIO2G6]|nr:HypC/HybG/HupF family hydrogenase formation chaperone [Cyanothece sp. SIO2G6]